MQWDLITGNIQIQGVNQYWHVDSNSVPHISKLEALNYFKTHSIFKYRSILKFVILFVSWVIILPPGTKSSLNRKLARCFLVIKMSSLIIERKSLQPWVMLGKAFDVWWLYVGSHICIDFVNIYQNLWTCWHCMSKHYFC